MSTRIIINQPDESKRLNAGDVKFLIIHYTAGDYQRAKYIFEHPLEFDQVSVQFVLDLDGTIDELIPTSSGITYQANHCGASYWMQEDEILSGFNKFSIGVEIINPNGNLLDYTEQQYQSLLGLIKRLQEYYPNLRSASSILGHEQIAGFRGKVDPGVKFNWSRVFSECYGLESFERRGVVCVPPALIAIFESCLDLEPLATNRDANVNFWRLISATMEMSMSLLANGQSLPMVEHACRRKIAELTPK
ncbi:N-acetylmuramoyl-L-alanine amidase [Mucilaginibacter ginsenosidivorax]|uniref:N-acetylmuramoyl-L-alanine amidase n=1 Tax=Mucilaginibacter ginsenosidivorax TaxID=862126 RepID=A0A5B8W7N0_9SPHI|nr:N-acetylmuramoyl-L-alanine amidase [Mucilaginibacter ginsenosidivorax]QEC78965.1 N-acetylmuramoyl-L-alanine amidase [Mucilaginibacter ginsenosidivorax]